MLFDVVSSQRLFLKKAESIVFYLEFVESQRVALFMVEPGWPRDVDW